MAVGSSFDQWQKDVFFTAAEEVQESADTMESLYRMWVRNRRDGFESEDSEGLLRELQTALGTAKWQLEEFERAVRFSHDSYLSEESTTVTRHIDFVAAIKSQILRIEKEIYYLLCEEGKQPLRWVQLDEEERDDLAAFLSGVTRNGVDSKDKAIDFKRSQLIYEPDCIRGLKEKISKDDRCVVEVARKERYSGKDNGVCMEVEQQDGNGRTLISPDNGSWKIDICNEEDLDQISAEDRSDLQTHESATSGFERVAKPTTYLNWFRNSFRNVKSGDHLQPRLWLSKYLYLKGVLRLVKGINQFITRSRYRLTSYKEDSSLRTQANSWKGWRVPESSTRIRTLLKVCSFYSSHPSVGINHCFCCSICSQLHMSLC